MRDKVLRKNPIIIKKDCIDIWSGSIEHGMSFSQGIIPFLDNAVHIEDFVYGLENPTDCKPQLLGYLHSFSWLRDLKAGTDLSQIARKLVNIWMQAFETNPNNYDPYIGGIRIVNIALMYEFLTYGASSEFLKDLNKSIKKQVELLYMHLKNCNNPLIQFQIIRGLLFSGYENINTLQNVLNKIKENGHITRSPLMLLFFLKDILDIKITSIAKEILDDSISDLVQDLRTLRHGDGKLSSFLGFTPIPEIGRIPYEIPANWIDIVLSLLGSQGKSGMRAMGYERCFKSGNLIIMNLQESAREEDSVLAFEWSFERQRLLKRFLIPQVYEANEVLLKRNDSKESVFLDIELKNSNYRRIIEVFENKIEGSESNHNKKIAILIPFKENTFEFINENTAILKTKTINWVLKVKNAKIVIREPNLQIHPDDFSTYNWTFEKQEND